MQFEIRHRWTGAVLFTAEIKADDTTLMSVKIGLAVSALVGMRQDTNLYARAVAMKMNRDKRKRLQPEERGLLTAVKETETTLAEAFLKCLTHSERRKVIARLKAKIKEGSL